MVPLDYISKTPFALGTMNPWVRRITCVPKKNYKGESHMNSTKVKSILNGFDPSAILP